MSDLYKNIWYDGTTFSNIPSDKVEHYTNQETDEQFNEPTDKFFIPSCQEYLQLKIGYWMDGMYFRTADANNSMGIWSVIPIMEGDDPFVGTVTDRVRYYRPAFCIGISLGDIE